MVARAEAAQATHRAILDAALALFGREPFARVTLGRVAGRAGVTVQTVLRLFGSKEALFAAVAEREGARIRSERRLSAETDLATALSTLVAHYEKDGDLVLHLLAQEQDCPPVAQAVAEGRRVHRAWVERHCRSLLLGTRGGQRQIKVSAAIAATDLSTWRLLRRDLGLDPEQTTAAMLALLHGLKE
jgi:AcrR family transcriptional regulator